MVDLREDDGKLSNWVACYAKRMVVDGMRQSTLQLVRSISAIIILEVNHLGIDNAA